MAINNFTLNNLYNNGILDYIPYDLCNTTPIGSMQTLQNPFRNIVAEQKGNLSSLQQDIYQPNSNNISQNYTNNGYVNNNIGELPTNTFAVQMQEMQNSPLLNQTYTTPGLGLIGQDGRTGLGLVNNYQHDFFDNGENQKANTSGLNLGNNFSNGMKNLISTIQNSPNLVKGIVSATLLLGTLMLCFKFKKKPNPQTKTSFFAKFNPMNMFRKLRNK